jgi:Brp/Blh family beta-carotene 15,15'-monooxygenase
VTGASLLLRQGRGGQLGERVQQGVVLSALALGMPHGAADAELLRSAGRGSPRRTAALMAGYAALATASTVVVRGGGAPVERAVLLASAAHFTEGELACWDPPPSGWRRGRLALRALTAAVVTVGLPAAVGSARQLPEQVGMTGAVAATGRALGQRSGLDLLRCRPRPAAALAATGTAAMALTGDRATAADTGLLLALDLLAPPASSFAAYFGWHALRHTARVLDALVADGQFAPSPTLPRSVALLGRRTAWASAVGLAAGAALALRDPRRASDQAFAVVLGLTVPHMTTVTLQLARRRSAARESR